MTRKEKINQLNDIFAEINEDDNAVCYLTSEDNELIESAIEALQQKPCEDCISRQAAIDALDTGLWGSEWDKALATAMLKDLPPVQPKPKTGHWIFDEILDRNYYCSECKSMGVDYWDYCPYCGCRMVEPQESEET